MKIGRWILIVSTAALLAFCIRIFLLETIRVASPAMTDSQRTGDRILVEKWTIGARLPDCLGLPFAPDSLFHRRTFVVLQEGGYRTKGLSSLKRNDILAFCDPRPDLPLDKSPMLLSRCVGLPGEFLELRHGKLHIDGKQVERHPDASFCFRFPAPFQDVLRKALSNGSSMNGFYPTGKTCFIYLTRPAWYQLCKRQKPFLKLLKPCFSSYDSKTVLIPAKGLKMELNDSTFRLYAPLINHFEGGKLFMDTTGTVWNNGSRLRYYTFKENYYFFLNDHQGYLNDSRSLGLIPERCVVGKAWVTLISPSRKRFLEKI